MESKKTDVPGVNATEQRGENNGTRDSRSPEESPEGRWSHESRVVAPPTREREDSRLTVDRSRCYSVSRSQQQQPPPTQVLLPGDLLYTPAMTTLPNEFSKMGYRSRFADHEVDIFIVVTMYNEGRDELSRTIHGICENLATFHSQTHDEEFWRRIVVCIVSDGRAKANQQALLYATELGFFSREAVAHQVENYDGTGMHLFESVVNVPKAASLNATFPPLNVMFALKENNGGKINSHWWFFQAFADQIKPKYCFLLDVGTKPRKRALFYLYDTMQRNKQIAGCCGEITTMKQFNLNPLVAAQTFEYKVANFFDKTFEVRVRRFFVVD